MPAEKVIVVDGAGQVINTTPSFGEPVAPSNTVDLENPGKIYVNGVGDISFVMHGNGQVITFTDFSGWLPVIVRRVNLTGTTATEIVVFW